MFPGHLQHEHAEQIYSLSTSGTGDSRFRLCRVKPTYESTVSGNLKAAGAGMLGKLNIFVTGEIDF